MKSSFKDMLDTFMMEPAVNDIHAGSRTSFYIEQVVLEIDCALFEGIPSSHFSQTNVCNISLLFHCVLQVCFDVSVHMLFSSSNFTGCSASVVLFQSTPVSAAQDSVSPPRDAAMQNRERHPSQPRVSVAAPCVCSWGGISLDLLFFVMP